MDKREGEKEGSSLLEIHHRRCCCAPAWLKIQISVSTVALTISIQYILLGSMWQQEMMEGYDELAATQLVMLLYLAQLMEGYVCMDLIFP